MCTEQRWSTAIYQAISVALSEVSSEFESFQMSEDGDRLVNVYETGEDEETWLIGPWMFEPIRGAYLKMK